MVSFFRAGLCWLAVTGVGLAQNPNVVSVSSSVGASEIVERTLLPVDEAPVPLVKGFNFELTTSSQHDSPTGWSSVLEPSLSYRFNPHFAADVSVPYYARVNAYVPVTVKGVTTTPLKTSSGLLGDTVISGQFDYGFKQFWYTAMVSLGVPTGDSELGLTANTVTYTINNHFERTMGLFTANVELGIGNSSSLANSAVRKTYTAVGNLGYFQAGTSVALPWSMMVEADAYEALPIGDQRVYGTITRGKRTVQVLEGTGVAEDNGFNVLLQVPLVRHLSMLGFYTRSLRQHVDTAGFSLTYVMRLPKKSE